MASPSNAQKVGRGEDTGEQNREQQQKTQLVNKKNKKVTKCKGKSRKKKDTKSTHSIISGEDTSEQNREQQQKTQQVNKKNKKVTKCKGKSRKEKDTKSTHSIISVNVIQPLEELIHSRSGFLVNDAVIIEADVESHLYTAIKGTDINDASEQYNGVEQLDTVPIKTDSQKILQVDVPETLGHFEALVEPVSEPPVVPAAGPLATLLAKKARVYTTASLDSVAAPVPAQSGAVHPCSTEVVSPTEPKLLLQQKDCVTQLFRILEAHMSEDLARIDDQAPEVTVGESLKATLESFIGMHQAMQKYKIQLDSKSKKLEELQVANTSLTISKTKAEDALKAAEKKASDEETKAAALEAELELLQTEKLIIEDKFSFALTEIEFARTTTKAKEKELAQEKASRANEIEDVCQKARDNALEEFGKEVGGLVNQYHLACHIRSLTLAGLEPKDPRWYDVGFPIDGPTPPLKFPWE